MRDTSLDRHSLIYPFEKMLALKDELWWGSRRKLERALKEWQKEDRHRYLLLKEAMLELDNSEQ